MKRIQEYLEKVLAQVRVKKIRPILGRELEDHLLLQTQEYQRLGMDQEQAQQQAVVDMGDPVALGNSWTESTALCGTSPCWCTLCWWWLWAW